ADMNSEPYKKVFELGKSIVDIPGNQLGKGVSFLDGFLKNRTLAMIAGTNWFRVEAFVQNTPSMSWDMVQYPSYEDRPNVYVSPDLQGLSISTTSQHKDAAMKLLEVFFSDQVQLTAARTGAITAMQDSKFKQQFAADLPFANGKNVQAFFKS